MIKYKHDRLLEREKDAVLSEAKSENIGGIKPEMAWGKTKRQRWIYFSSPKKSPLRRFLSRLCKGTSTSDGSKDWTTIITNGSSTPYKWEQAGQQNRKPCPTPKFIHSFKGRTKGGNI